MGMDTIQLEDAVSTISQEYLLEFSSEYFIPENLHPELPGPGDHIVDFPEGKIGVYIKKFKFANFRIPISQFLFDILGYYQIHLSQLSVIEMDLFNLIKAPNPTKVKTGTRQRAAHEVPLMTATVSRVIQMVDAAELSTSLGATKATMEPNLVQEMISMGPTIRKRRRQRDAGEEGPKAPAKSIQHEPGEASGYGLPVEVEIRVGGETFEEIWAQVARRDQRIATREKHIKELEAQLEAEINMKKATEVKNSEVTKELEDLRMRFSGLEVGNAQLSQHVSVLQAQVMGEKRIMAAFEEFKKHEDERVSARCAEMDARLDTLSVDFDEELYRHMLTAIAGCRWVIRHGLRLAVMKCAKSTELRQAFANVVSAGIAKGMSEGLKYGVEHGKAGLELTAVEAYDPEADNKYVDALHNLKDLSYPLIDELEQLKDVPLDVIMVSLYLESDTGEDVPQSIRYLRPSSSQLKILVYPEVRNPRNPWAYKDEILLGDAITANISRAEKKKRIRVVCHTHRVGSAHHARSDGIPVSVPIIAPLGLQILLADAATQTKHKESPRLLRSKSLPALFTLDFP
ncbi:hypothetical protein Tco_0251999 [Tanacetum coccineum]